MTESYLFRTLRTPFGKYGGALAGIRPDDLAAFVVSELLARTPGLDPADVSEVVFGNASPLSDGAAVVLLGSAAAAGQLGAPLARIASRAASANEPQFFGAAPIAAAEWALRRAGIGWSDLSAVELNEAFAAQALVCIRAWDIDPELVNQHGGALALGHPLGASGARLIGTLAATLQANGGRWGLAAICIGVGQALAVVLENMAATVGSGD